MGRIAAIDYGLKRIGIAISDEGKKIAFPLETVPGGKGAIEHIQKALNKRDVELILVGFPLLMSGQEGEMALLVKKFAADLELALQIPCLLIDERLSSKQADRSMKEIHLNRKERTEKMDTAAASFLLQSFLDRTP